MSSDYPNITAGDILLRLRQQYRNIFSEASIRQHFENHIQDSIGRHHLEYILMYGKPQSLLDVGCGYGSFVLLARKRGIEAVGLEIEPFEVQYARQRAEQEDTSNLPPSDIFWEGSGCALPFKDGSFEAVTLWDVLEHIEDYDQVLSEVTRVLKLGGRVFISCPNYLSFRKEAHYQVPWFPLLPKKAAAMYLKLLGRDPSFLLRSIFYRTNWQILRALNKRGYQLTDHRMDKIKHPELVNQEHLRRLLQLGRGIGMGRVMSLLLTLQTINPFKRSVVICAIKKS